MWRLIANLYSRRIVNVNVNILAAAVLALVPVLGIVKGYHALGLDPRWLPVVTFLADVVCDVGIYFVLHFLANHAGRPFHKMHTIADASVEHVPFFKDATKVQLQRAVLSPLLYGLWLGAQWFLVNVEGWGYVPATALGCFIGVGVARILHTLWMIWELQLASRARRKAATGPGPALAPQVASPSTADSLNGRLPAATSPPAGPSPAPRLRSGSAP